jgi:hypothetical protein
MEPKSLIATIMTNGSRQTLAWLTFSDVIAVALAIFVIAFSVWSMVWPDLAAAALVVTRR